MNKISRKARSILIDIAGFGLVLLSLFLAPIPGPGGIQVFLAGFALLSINHEWAKRRRDKLLEHGSKTAAKIFPENRTVQLIYDLLAIGLFASSIVLFSQAKLNYIMTGFSLFFSALTILLINRGRGSRIGRRIKKK